MTCIDCHTATGLMGDGHAYDDMKKQTDITCQACHSPVFSTAATRDSLAGRLAFLNKRVPGVTGVQVGTTKKETPIYNLQKRDGGLIFFRKMDGLPIEMKPSPPDKPHHQLKGHERLSCQACHTAWIPQCYGCHIQYRPSDHQFDWLSRQKRPGKWKEARSYMRFSKPALGVRDNREIVPISPCQMVVSLLDVSGNYQKEKSFSVMNLSAFDPHTTSKGSRTCLECHEDPKVLGLGEGILYPGEGNMRFRPTHDGTASEMGLPHPPDGFTNLAGEPLQTGIQNGVRPFKKPETDRILAVAPCLGCHQSYTDPIYRDFEASRKQFQTDGDLPCLQ